MQFLSGGAHNYPKGQSQGYYTLGFAGASLFSQGSPVSASTISDSDPIAFGGSPVLADVENGKTKLGGTVVSNQNAISVQKLGLPLTGLFKDPNFLRVRLGYDSQTQNASFQNVLAGLEFKPDLFGNQSATQKSAGSSTTLQSAAPERWIGLGLATETRSFTDVAGANHTQTIPCLEFRGRVGWGFNAVVSDGRVDEARRQAAILVAFARNFRFPVPRGDGPPPKTDGFDSMKNVAINIANQFGMEVPADATGKGTDPGQTLSLPELARGLRDYQGITAKGQLSVEDQKDADAKAHKAKADAADAVIKLAQQFLQLDDKTAAASIYRNAPRVSLYGEFDGSYGLEASQYVARVRTIWSLNARIDLTPQAKSSIYFLAHYENGYTRAAPTVRSAALVFSFGITL